MSGLREYQAAARAVADRKRFFRDSEIMSGEARAVLWFVLACMACCALAAAL
jgi:hypothetical protein